MKGILKKTESGWIVNYDYTVNKNDWCTLPLHPADVEQINKDSQVFDNIEARIAAYPEIEFEIVNKMWGVNDDIITYAKLIKPSIQHSITDYGVEGIDSCLEYKEDDVEKLAETEYPIFDGGLLSIAYNQKHSRIDFIKGYNKAKETLYTEEQLRELISLIRTELAKNQYNHYSIDYDQLIQSLKQPKQ
jgi:hypothetical protein